MNPLLLAAAILIKVLPSAPLIEQARGQQVVNFDFLIENTSEAKVELTRIELAARTPDGKLVLHRQVQDNGDSISTLPARTLEPHAKIVVYNPFYALPAGIDLSHLEYDFTFGEKDHVIVNVQPRAFRPKTVLSLPLGGRVLIHDGHDFYAHHRRLDVTGGMTTALGITSNMTRYAYDFVVVNEHGDMFKGDGSHNADWYGFGVPVYAPGAGTVVAAFRDEPDHGKDSRFEPDLDEIRKNVLRIGGNYVLIDHGNGEYSWIAHMKQGSVLVKAGDKVKAGQPIGAMGASGDSIFPHVHYQLQSDNYLGEGLPSYFANVRRFDGKGWVAVADAIDTGDVVTPR